LFETFTVILVDETVPVTLAGFGGLVPYMYFSASCKISSRRQVQSDTLEIRVPSSLVKGSGSSELAVKALGRETGQLAPVSSTGLPAAAALAVLVAAVTVPAATSASASMTTTERIAERPELIIIRTLLLGAGAGSGSEG